MKKKSAVTRRLLKNFNRLIPFLGFLLVITGILGLIFVQKPLEETQDLRSDASEYGEVFLPNIMPTTDGRTLYVEETSVVSLDLNLANDMSVESAFLIFNIINDSIDVPLITINAGSGLRAEAIEVEETEDGYLVKIIAVPNNLEWLEPPADTSFLKISLAPVSEGTLSLNFDTSVSHIQGPEFAYAIDAQNINYDIIARPIVCGPDTFHCEDGTVVGRVPPSCDFEQCPDVEATPTPTPTINTCNERCSSNSECEIGHRCFDTGTDKRCRLATSPSSTDCSQVYDQSCNEYCITSDDCQNELGCWDNKCRNPENIESVTCADLTPAQQESFINSCGEYCTDNSNCAVNLRCYDNVCRSASNPSSLTCSATTQKTVSNIYEEEGRRETSLTKLMMLPVQKGDNIIPDDDSQNNQDVDNIEPTKRVEIPGDEVPVDETAFDLLMKMIKDKRQGLPTAILVIGGVLLLASLLTLLLAKALKFKPKETKLPDSSRSIDVKSHDVKPGSVPKVKPGSDLKTRKLSPEKKSSLMEKEKVKEVMSAHKFKPKPPEPKEEPRPMIKPMVKKESPNIKHKNTEASSQNAKIKDLLSKLNKQSDKEKQG